MPSKNNSALRNLINLISNTQNSSTHNHIKLFFALEENTVGIIFMNLNPGNQFNAIPKRST